MAPILLFSECENNLPSLHMCFYQINTTKKLLKVVPSKWGNFEQKEISVTRTVTICAHTNQTKTGVCHFWARSGENNF